MFSVLVRRKRNVGGVFLLLQRNSLHASYHTHNAISSCYAFSANAFILYAHNPTNKSPINPSTARCSIRLRNVFGDERMCEHTWVRISVGYPICRAKRDNVYTAVFVAVLGYTYRQKNA